MTNRYTGGVISATAPTVSQSGASGVWNLEEAQYYQKAGLWPPGSGADPYFQNTTLLLHGDGTNGAQNNSFVDSSVNNFTITRNGNTTQGAFNPYVGPGCWSNYFDGTGDYLTFPQTALQFSTNDFTVEAWVYFSAIATDQYIFNYASSGPTHVGINYYSGAWRIGGFNSYLVTGGTASAGQWYHVAMVRSANNLRAYINGTQIGSTVSVSGVTFSASGVGYIGAYYLSGSNLNGLISNLRITKGVALYTSAFTPSTTPLVATTQTILLTCNNNGFIDQSAANNTLTRNGGTQVSKFSPFTLYQVTPTSYSGYFDGTGDYLTAPASNSTIWPGSGSFTIEYWLYLPANPSAGYYTHFSYGTAGSVLRVFNTAATSKIEVFSGASVILNPAWPTAGQWNHFALVRNGTTLTLYINGAVAQSVTNSTDFSTGTLTIGGESASNPLLGSISNFRIVKGTAVYTSAFTPPTSPLTAISGTSLLTCQSTTFIDNSTNAFTITAFGNATPKRANPFTDTVTGPTSYTGSTYAGSAYFDGSGDYLTLTGSSNLAFGLNNFTIEVWIYPTVAADRMIYDGRPNSITGPYPTLYIGATNQVFYYTVGANRIVGGTIQYYAWNHIALVRSSGTTRLYLNGALLGSYVDATNYANGTARPIIGADGGNVATLNMLGYLSNLRVVNGTAVYTGPFVPPAAPATAVSGTQLLVNGTNAGIFDNTTLNNLETVGSAQVSTSVVKYGTGSMYFDGTTGYLAAGSANTYALGSGNFTVECWINPSSVAIPQNIIMDWRSSNNSNLVFYLINAQVVWRVNTAQQIQAGAISASTWTHLAVVKNGTTTTLYIDGTSAGSFTDTLTYGIDNLKIGKAWDANYWFGYMDDIRITKGVARYTANFTPPAGPFPNF